MSDRQPPGTGPDDDLLQRLADLHAGGLGQEEETRLRAEIAGDAKATAMLHALERARAEFAALGTDPRFLEGVDDPAIGEMPEHAVARLDAAIAQEARNRANWSARAAPGGSSAQTPTAADRVVPPTLVAVPPGGTRTSHEPAPVPSGGRARRRKRAVAIAAAAAVLLVVVGVVIGVVATAPGSDPTGPRAGAPTGPGGLGSATAIATGVASPGRDNVISPDGRALYLADTVTRQIVVIGLDTPTRRTIQLSGQVEGMALSRDGAKLWVSTTESPAGSARPEGRLARLDAASGTVEKATVISGKAGALSPSPGGGPVLWSVDDAVAFMNPDDLSRTGVTPLGGRADQLDVTADGSRAYANVTGSIVEIDPAARIVLSRHEVPGRDGPLRLAVNPATPLFAVSSEAMNVAIFALGGGQTPTTIPSGPSATMTWPRDGSELYFTSRESTTVAAVKASNLLQVERLPVPADPLDVVSGPDGRHVYVVYRNELRVLDR